MKVVLTAEGKAYIRDWQDIDLVELLPHPDGDPVMTKEGAEIILDKLHIKHSDTWFEQEWVNSKSDWELVILDEGAG
jgi:hypothetical protein